MRCLITLLFIFLSVPQLHARQNAADTALPGQWQQGKDNLQYRIIKRDAGKPLQYGFFMQLHIKQVYSGSTDTILMDTRDYCSRMQVFDSISTPVAFYDILGQLKTGDSVIIRMLSDNVFKNPDNPMPDFIKKGHYLYTTVKLLDIFESAQMADSVNKEEMRIAGPRIYAAQLATVEKDIANNKATIDADGKRIEAFLLKNKIKARKTKWGTYIAVIKEGTGKQIDNKSIITVNYTGRIMKTGKIFDSNTVPSFQHVQPLEVDMSQLSSMIVGFSDGLLQLKKGSIAKLYIPSPLGYGTSGNEPKIKPNDIIVFDIKVLTVKEIK